MGIENKNVANFVMNFFFKNFQIYDHRLTIYLFFVFFFILWIEFFSSFSFSRLNEPMKKKNLCAFFAHLSVLHMDRFTELFNSNIFLKQFLFIFFLVDLIRHILYTVLKLEI